jgi:hypothetical protein
MAVPQDIKKLTGKLFALIPSNLLHVPGQREGLLLRPGPTGVYLSFVDLFGIPKNFTKVHRNWMLTVLAPRFPNLDLSPMLARSSETLRRFNSVEGRIALAQEDMKTGKVIALESLDMSGSTPRPIVPSAQLSTQTPSGITRAFTFVRLDPPPARRLIIFSDLPMKDKNFNRTIIPDEIVASYPISDAELAAVKKATPTATFTSFTEIDNQVKNASEIRITCGDINKELVGEALKKHFEKTLRGLAVVTEKLIKDFGITPTGRVFAEAIDSFLHSAEAKFRSPSGVAMQRQTAEGTRSAMIAELAPDPVTGEFKPTKLQPLFSGSALEVAKNLEFMMIIAVNKLEEVLNALPKKPKP